MSIGPLAIDLSALIPIYAPGRLQLDVPAAIWQLDDCTGSGANHDA
jgi:hypothetical protein